MGHANGASWNNARPDLVAETFHLSQQIVEYHASLKRSEAAHVLKDAPIRLAGGNNGKSRRPEPTVILTASPLSGATRGLAGNACGEEEVATMRSFLPLASGITPQPPSCACGVGHNFGRDVSDNSDLRYVWPVLRQHPLAPRVYLALKYWLNSAPLGGKRKAADTRE